VRNTNSGNTGQGEKSRVTAQIEGESVGEVRETKTAPSGKTAPPVSGIEFPEVGQTRKPS